MVAKITKDFTAKIKGFHVIGDVRTGKEAWKDIKKNPPDLLILDVYMPDVDGLELLQKIRMNNMKTDVIMVTAAKECGIVEQCLRLGVIDYILKPFTYERFEKSLVLYYDRRLNRIFPQFSQETLDRLLFPGNGSNEPDLPKGLQRLTMNHIIAHFKENPVFQAVDEIAQATGLSSATVQRYMKYLISHDIVEMQLTYGAKGRPEQKYKCK